MKELKAVFLAGFVVVTGFASSAIAQVQTGIYWDHNGSYMQTIRNGDTVKIIYDAPRSGIRKHGVKPGTVLFRGRITGRRLAGTAYIFKRGCQPASYNVSGNLRLGDFGAHRIVLKGASPVRKGCIVTGYKNSGSNARLVFKHAGTGD